MIEDLQNRYIDETAELIENLESQVLNLEKDSSSQDSINEIFRVLHTIKGTASMFGFNRMGQITHDLETVYDEIREGERGVDNKLISITLKTIDFLNLLLHSREKLSIDQESQYNELLSNIIDEYSEKDGGKEKTDNHNAPKIEKGTVAGYYILFKPDKDVLTRGVRPYDIFEDLNTIGKYTSIPEIESKKAEYKFNEDFKENWEIFLVSEKTMDEVGFVFMFFNENEYAIVKLDNHDFKKNEEFINVYSPLHSKDTECKEALGIFNKLGFLVKNDIKKDVSIEEKSASSDIAKLKQNISSVRVGTEKLDNIINIIGELIIVNSRLSFLAKKINDAEVKKALEYIEKLSKNLRDNTLQLRLVQIEKLTTKFKRMVRDLSEKLDKEVDFITDGTDTELDSNIINQLDSPLMHIIRNGIDHGIETSGERIKQNKPAKGIIRLFAYYSGSNVFIQVQDDGKGIDPDYIRKKAIDKGIITPTSKLDKKELYDLIFLPGFSTAQNLTEVSGRGVGMDVVRKKITELRGDIEIDSEIGLGTSFTIKLPLTLSIIDTLMVKIADIIYLIPLNYVESCHKKFHSELFENMNRRVEYNNEVFPFIYLREEFELEGETPAVENLVIIKINDKNYAIVVDNVLGEHQAVLKPINLLSKKRDYFIGASVLGNGYLALILDINQLVSKMKEYAEI